MDAITRYLGVGSYAQWDEKTRQSWLLTELQGKRPLLPRNAALSELGFDEIVQVRDYCCANVKPTCLCQCQCQRHYLSTWTSMLVLVPDGGSSACSYNHPPSLRCGLCVCVFGVVTKTTVSMGRTDGWMDRIRTPWVRSRWLLPSERKRWAPRSSRWPPHPRTYWRSS